MSRRKLLINKKRVLFELSEDLYNKLLTEANINEESVNSLLRKIIIKYFNNK